MKSLAKEDIALRALLIVPAPLIGTQAKQVAAEQHTLRADRETMIASCYHGQLVGDKDAREAVMTPIHHPRIAREATPDPAPASADCS